MTLEYTMDKLASECGWTVGEWTVLHPTENSPSRIRVCGGRGQVDIYDAPLTRETLANAKAIAAWPRTAAALYNLLREANDDGITQKGVNNALDALEAAGIDCKRFGR